MTKKMEANACHFLSPLTLSAPTLAGAVTCRTDTAEAQASAGSGGLTPGLAELAAQPPGVSCHKRDCILFQFQSNTCMDRVILFSNKYRTKFCFCFSCLNTIPTSPDSKVNFDFVSKKSILSGQILPLLTMVRLYSRLLKANPKTIPGKLGRMKHDSIIGLKGLI